MFPRFQFSIVNFQLSISLFPYQRDIDQPLVRISRYPARAGARYGNSKGWPFLEARLALRHGMDFPLLEHAGAFEYRVTLGHCASCSLGHRHS
jgi:hypothetical protein